MKITNITEVNDFLAVVDSCENDVWLTSPNGDKYNLKSKLCQYIAMGKLLGVNGDRYELFASSKADEARLLSYFIAHPEVA